MNKFTNYSENIEQGAIARVVAIAMHYGKHVYCKIRLVQSHDRDK